MIYVILSTGAGFLAALRLFFVLDFLEPSVGSAFIVLNALLMFSAYCDLGFNQGLLYRATAIQLDTSRQAAQELVAGAFPWMGAITLISLPLFLVFVSVVADISVITGFELLAVGTAYVLAFCVNNYVQVHLRISNELTTLGVFTFASAMLNVTLTYFLFLTPTFSSNTTLIFLLLPLSIFLATFLFAIFGQIGLRNYSGVQISATDVREYVEKGFGVSAIGMIAGYAIIAEKILIESLTDQAWSDSYLFFCIVSGVVITINGYFFHVIFGTFFGFEQLDKKQGAQRSRSICWFIAVLFSLCIAYYFAAFYVLESIYVLHREYIEYLKYPMITAFFYSVVSFVVQNLMANFGQRTNLIWIGSLVFSFTFGLNSYNIFVAEDDLPIFVAGMVGALALCFVLLYSKRFVTGWHPFFALSLAIGGLYGLV